MGMGMRMSTVHTYSSVLSRTLREEEAVEGGLTIYDKYMLVLECLPVPAGLKLYLPGASSTVYRFRFALENNLSKPRHCGV
jgi:hypothetical protein